MDGLIIKKKWLDKIIVGEKTLEIRGGRTTKLREKIYLLESGSQVVRGECIIYTCYPITDEFVWDDMKKFHLVEMSYEELLKIYKTPYAWVLRNVKEHEEKRQYNHPAGAVIWVRDIESKIRFF